MNVSSRLPRLERRKCRERRDSNPQPPASHADSANCSCLVPVRDQVIELVFECPKRRVPLLVHGNRKRQYTDNPGRQDRCCEILPCSRRDRLLPGLRFPCEQKFQPPAQVVHRSIEIADSPCVCGYFHSLKVEAQIICKLSGTLDTLCR